ncbi:MAG: T9SS type A sorting domain-containing protein [Saprospiraceae bacterium]|nr:T9SS type A sorting domain-containing protein [Saprospiraceae bacterium]
MKQLKLHFSVIFFLLFIRANQGQELKWIYKIGGTTAEYGNGLAIDSDQNIFDITNFMGTVIVANNLSFTSKGADDVLIRKSTSLGILQWVKQLGSTKSDISYDVSVDLDDNLFIVGTFQHSLFLGTSLILSSTNQKLNSFIVKLNTNGELLWARKLESDIAVTAKSVTAGLAEELVISGYFEGNASFASLFPPFNLASNGGNDIFILKMNGNTGQALFLKRIGGSDHEFVSQHTRDNQNNIYVTGDYRQVLDFDPGIGEALVNTKGLTDIFVLKLSATGNFLWVNSYGGTNVDYGHSVTTDAQRNVIITGKYSETVSFGLLSDQELISKGGTDIFVLKLDQNGNTIWANGMGSPQNDQGNQVLVNNTGITYLCGLYRGKVDFNTAFERKNESESNGGADMFVLILNQDGTYNEHFARGGIANDQINDIGLKLNGDLISTGGFGAIVDFDPTSGELNILSNGGLDAYLINDFICVNPYLKVVNVPRPEVCKGDRGLIQITEGYLNGASQWSWQKDSCSNITFASGSFIDQVLNKSINYYLKGSGGCIINSECRQINIKVFTDSLIYQNIDLCQGDTIFVGKSKYTTAGVFVDSLISKAGCDSVIVSEIGLFPKFNNINRYTICNGDTIKVGTSNYTFGGSFVDILSSIHGCDSTIISIIELLPSKIENVEVTICKGESITVGNASYTLGGTYIQSSTGENGCEDLLIVKVKVLETNFSQTISLCQGQSYLIGTSNYTASGVYTNILESSAGCDSIVVTNLTFFNTSTSQKDYTLCEGDSIKVGNKVYKRTGNFIDTLMNSKGCDSIVFSDVRVLIVPAIEQKKYLICEGAEVIVGPKIYKATGIYKDTLDAKNGCDSIIISDVFVSQKLYFVKEGICNGDSVKFGDSVYYDTGLYSIGFKNLYGCDSIIILDLTVLQDVAQTFEYAICPGDTVKVGNSIYKNPGIFVDKFTSGEGCDSIVTSKIRWNHIILNEKIKLCKGDSVKINNIFYKESATLVDTFTKSDGCDSIVNIVLNVYPRYEIDTLFELCKGGSIQVGNNIYVNEGKFAESLKSVNGCDSTVFFDIKIINFSPIFFKVKDSLKAFIVPGGIYQWFDCSSGVDVPIADANSATYVVTKSGKYKLSISYKECTYFSNCVDVIKSSTQDNNNANMLFYPNPVSNVLTINVPLPGKAIIQSISGPLKWSVDLKAGINDIDVNHMLNGAYFIEIETGGQIKTGKLIKTN